jgi:para-nitrobenzyl esterase
VRAAKEFGNAALQTVGPGFGLRAEQSEDCLYLNVWSGTLDAAARQPVMVWIHGGGFLNGAASMRDWSGESLAAKGVTVVSLNYRLGAFGFLYHPEGGANFGVLDWVAALEWVAVNIAAFGGDPDNVTIFGQSAGAAAARTLLSVPVARGLFRRAILQSAGFEDYAVVESPSFERVVWHSRAVFDRLGGHDLETLRSAPAEEVRRASRAECGMMDTTPGHGLSPRCRAGSPPRW